MRATNSKGKLDKSEFMDRKVSFMKFLVNLKTVEDVKTFVKSAENYDCDIMVQNRDRAFMVDGASVMGMFSLDLRTPVIVHIKDTAIGEKFKDDVAGFVVE